MLLGSRPPPRASLKASKGGPYLADGRLDRVPTQGRHRGQEKAQLLRARVGASGREADHASKPLASMKLTCVYIYNIIISHIVMYTYRIKYTHGDEMSCNFLNRYRCRLPNRAHHRVDHPESSRSS